MSINILKLFLKIILFLNLNKNFHNIFLFKIIFSNIK